ncbi:unnamed protein product [Closterium sp. NIES-54]
MARLFPSAGPTAELLSSFTFDRVIGQGQFGRVWRCMHIQSGSWFACKKIRKSQLSAHDLESLKNEVASMERLRGHRHVLQLLALFEDEKTVYIVTDLCDAGDMFALVSQAKGLPEQAAAVVFSQIAEAVRWCHVHGIVHRDIKPENVLLVTRTSDSGRNHIEACLGDFGLALQIPDGFMIRGAAGSAPYEAPEVVASDPYNVTADVWSLGVLLYAMLSAKLPSFPSDKRVLIPEVDFSVSPWPSISEEAKHLIRRMMTVDSTQRPNIQEVLQHPWVAGRGRASPRSEPTPRRKTLDWLGSPASSAIPATPDSPSSTLSPLSPGSPSSPLSPSASDTFLISSPSSLSSPHRSPSSPDRQSMDHPRHRRHYKLSPLAS